MNKVNLKPPRDIWFLLEASDRREHHPAYAMGRWLEALLILLSHRAHMCLNLVPSHDTDQNHRIMLRRAISYYVLMQVRCPNSESPSVRARSRETRDVTFKEIVVCLATN